MTEHIQWGGELPTYDLVDITRMVAHDLAEIERDSLVAFMTNHLRLIGQFWDEVNRLYEEAQARSKDPDGFPNFEGGYSCGREDALIDILELSKKYPFG